mmetsp:Transcript_25634/g.44858  ORF Transcript_25634/g.44858 Transcript_25634/m.44858 type:complete len:677 (-) Transcript_25634:2399-4429(-)
MLTVETSTRLAELFWSVIEGERQVEIVRQVLAELEAFSPYGVFRQLDHFNNGYLTSADLVDFLRKSSVDVGEREGYLLLRACDSNSDGRLSYSDFTYAVLPDSLPHRELVKARAQYDDEGINGEVLYALVRVFERELQYLRDIESRKEHLICRPDFNLLDAFRRVDQLDDSWLSRDSVRRFLLMHEFSATSEDLDAFMRRIDKDHDEQISYLEFVDCVLPAEPYYQVHGSLNSTSSLNYSQSLRNSGSLRASFEVSPVRSSYENPMRITDRESIESPLKGSSRGSLKQVSNELTRSTMSPSSYSSPSKFSNYTASSPLKKSEKSLRFSPLRSSRDSLRSPDKGKYTDQYLSPPLRASRREALKSPEKSKLAEQYVSTPLRASRSLLTPSPLRASTPMKASELSLSPSYTPSRQKKVSLTPKKTPKKSPSTAKKSRPSTASRVRSYKSLESQELIKNFISQISLDKNLDTVRQELSLRADFNIADAYRMFDTTNKGYITGRDMAETLRYLDLHPSTEDLYIWFRRFDHDSDGRLTYNDFSLIFTPRQCEYCKLLENRPSHNVPAAKRRGVFSQETQELIRKALILHLEVEGSAEAVRQKLVSLPSFDSRAVFSDLDLDQNGYVTLDEFRSALQDSGKYATERELIGLLSRYDRDKDGKVSYADFVQELTPKAHLRAY